MRTISDANTTIEQESKRKDIRFVMRLELLKQFEGAITDRDSATQIKVDGDATGLLANGDTFVIPLDSFSGAHVITSAPSYSGGKTTLVCSGSSFGTDIVGLHVAKRVIVSYGDTERTVEVGNFRYEVEGETLSEWQAADVDVVFDNGDGFFANTDDDGLFDDAATMWIRAYVGYKNASDRLLYFGGLAEIDTIDDDRYAKTFRVTFYGHLKELERYPGWYLSEELGKLPRITGIDLIGVNEPAGGTFEGIRTLSFNYPDGSDIEDLTINSLSEDTPVGIHIIKFRPPDEWSYDWGAFAAKTAGATGQTLTAAAGHTINIDMPDSYDVKPREDLFFLKDRLNRKADPIGKATLQYANGSPVQLKVNFEFIIFFDDSGSSYSDETHELSTPNTDEVTLFGAADDVIYIMSNEPFFGFYADVHTALGAGAAITWQYSSGYGSFATLTKTDGTNTFQQSGAVTWNALSNWRATDIIIDSVHYKNVYIIKLTCGTYSAGPLKLRRLYRYFRLIGEDGSTLDIKPVLEKLPMESREDDVILVNDSSDVLQPCTWIENISHHQYLINLLDAANYGSGARTVDDLKYSLASPVVAIWGKLPGFNYPKKVTAMCVDTSTSPETVWLGVEDELWKVTEKSQAEFVDRLDPYVRASDSKSFRLEIRRLVIDGAGYLQGMAWKSYFDQPKEGRDYDEYGFAFRTPAVVFRSTSLTAITEQNKIDSSGDSIFTSQEVFFRLGQLLGSYVYLGQYSSAATGVGGENLTLPFHQRVWFAYPSLGVVLENRSSLTDDTEQSTGVFFDHRELAPGHYALKASHADPTFFIGCCFTFGQPGFVVWDENQDKWAFLKWDGTNFYISYINYAGTITDYFDLSDTAKQVTCGCYYDGYVYLAVMECYYSGATFPGDYLDCKLERFDSGGSGKSTLFSFDSDSVEADQSLASGNEKYCTIIDMIYNENEDVIYGCLIDRSTLEYHVFAYDVSNDKLYTSQTGTGFTFDAGRQFKNFTYNSDDNTVYAVCADKRYKDSVAFLVTCEFTAPVGSPDGSEITLTYISNIMVGETDNVLMAMGGDGRIYGLTSEYNYIWQYDDVFYPRILLTDTGDDNIREVMTSISQVLNRVVNIRADRKVRFVTRDNYDGTKSLYEDTHITEMPPLQNWEHYYDMVEVSWNDPFTGHSGKESAGSGGWGRRVLSIENKLIQNQHLAALVASELHSFFNTRRKVISPVLIALIQLEEYDRVKCIMNSANVDVDRSDYYKLTAIDFDAENLVMEVRGVS